MTQYKITVHSRDRDPYLSKSPNNFTYLIPTFTDKVRSVYIESAQIYNSQYTITADVNDELFYSINGSGNQIVQIPQGYYSAIDLAAAVQTLMNANPVTNETYTVTYNSLTNRFKIVCSNSNFVLAHKGYYQPSAWLTLGWLIKLDDGQVGSHNITSIGATQIAPYPPKLSSNFYKIGIRDLQANQLDNTGIYPVCAIVPNDVPIGELNSYKPTFPFKIETKNYFDATKIRVVIYDDTNNEAHLQNDVSFVLVLQT